MKKHLIDFFFNTLPKMVTSCFQWVQIKLSLWYKGKSPEDLQPGSVTAQSDLSNASVHNNAMTSGQSNFNCIAKVHEVLNTKPKELDSFLTLTNGKQISLSGTPSTHTNISSTVQSGDTVKGSVISTPLNPLSSQKIASSTASTIDSPVVIRVPNSDPNSSMIAEKFFGPLTPHEVIREQTSQWIHEYYSGFYPVHTPMYLRFQNNRGFESHSIFEAMNFEFLFNFVLELNQIFPVSFLVALLLFFYRVISHPYYYVLFYPFRYLVLILVFFCIFFVLFFI